MLLLLITATWFIKYPEIIQGSAVLTGDNAPKEIVPKQSGRLTALFVKNNQQVKQGDIIGWLESNAATQAVIDLSKKLESSTELLGQIKGLKTLGNCKFRIRHLLQPGSSIMII